VSEELESLHIACHYKRCRQSRRGSEHTVPGGPISHRELCGREEVVGGEEDDSVDDLGATTPSPGIDVVGVDVDVYFGETGSSGFGGEDEEVGGGDLNYGEAGFEGSSRWVVELACLKNCDCGRPSYGCNVVLVGNRGHQKALNHREWQNFIRS